MKKAKKCGCGSKAKKVKAVNLKSKGAEVAGQSLESSMRSCGHSCSCLCGVRG